MALFRNLDVMSDLIFLHISKCMLFEDTTMAILNKNQFYRNLQLLFKHKFKTELLIQKQS